ncbi:MAG TPA: cell division protein ZapA [Pseudomonadaceae bacterium]|nr:cell division protein ZapA [Pseudomonadaceae bacterium]
MSTPSVTITILGRDYQISCPPEGEDALRRSARFLDQQMAKVKSRGGALAYEKIAVLAALNISHDLLIQNQQTDSSVHDSERGIRELEQKIDAVLLANRQIEI